MCGEWSALAQPITTKKCRPCSLSPCKTPAIFSLSPSETHLKMNLASLRHGMSTNPCNWICLVFGLILQA